MNTKKLFDILSDDWKDICEIVLYGFGKLGWANIEAIRKNFTVTAIIDNDPKYKGQNYEGIPILNLSKYMQLSLNRKIVVTTSGSRYKDIVQTLLDEGFKENVDFCNYTVLCKDYFWHVKKKVFIGRLTFNLTTFCTLNCKNCTMLTPYNRYKTTFDFDNIINDIDLGFQFVDYVSNFIIAGGEPLLYKNLKSLIEYIGEKYGEFIGKIQIITNGTIEIAQDLLDIIKKYSVEVRISDYTNNVPYAQKLDKLCALLEENDIEYVRFVQDTWLDMGFPNQDVRMGDTPTEIRNHMMNCAPNCQNINNGKLYYCAQGWAADQTKLFQLNEQDSLNLSSLKNDISGKERFKNFYFGDLEDGYFSFCRVCRGWDTDITVPGGAQYIEEKL